MRKEKNVDAPEAPSGGYRRIPVRDLRLDIKNPRLAELGVPEDATQSDLVKALWDEMAVEEVALSIAHSGYFEYEPLFVEDSPDGTHVVIEGNRRLAAVMLLLDAALRNKVRATKLPPIGSELRETLKELPVILTTRKDAWRYLGFKHVNGPATWGSYAKAQYIAFVHNTYDVPLSDIADQIGDRNSTVLRMYRGLMIIEQAEIRIGSRRISPEFLKRGLKGCAQLSGRRVRLLGSQVTEIKRRQTDAFRPGTKGCVVELDCHFQFAD